MTTDAAEDLAPQAPSATRHDLQLGRRLFHFANGVTIATAYALLFTHEQVVHTFGAVACLVYIADRFRIAYPEVVARRVPWVNRLFVRAEEQVRESAMTPFAIAVLLTILAVPKLAALIAIYTLAIADPLAAVIGIRYGRRRIIHNRTLEGTLAFFAATVAIALAVLRWGDAASPWMAAAVAIGVGAVAMLCELVPLRVDDNLTIPIVVGFAAWAMAWLAGVPLF
ncbi:MAG TPA: SEC59/DGK1/VTE5 family protein [Candidatus Dormibacteraeota bacterium]|nr:SEC59/DGK1/VTE5 family protein [Candidatus Dormibacteraeota bacterium]